MPRKTAIRISNAELRAEEARTDARKDAPRRPVVGIDSALGLTAAARRERLAMMEPAELLRMARRAAKLELRGAMYSSDDREDVAASIVATVLGATGGAMPRRESRRVAIGRLCGDAKNYRRAIDSRRERDAIDAEAQTLAYADTADALGIDSTPARHAEVIARSGAKIAARAASAICAELGIDADEDSPAWCVFYVWARDASPEQCAAEREVTWGAWRVRMTRGAKFVRGFYGATELLARLTLGATLSKDGVTYVRADDSREAHGRTPIMADPAIGSRHWREGTNGGARATRHETAAEARAACTVSRTNVRPKRERERAKGSSDARMIATADALAAIGREHMRQSRGRGKSSPRDSALATLAPHSATLARAD